MKPHEEPNDLPLLPRVCMSDAGSEVRMNFGERPFMYDVCAHEFPYQLQYIWLPDDGRRLVWKKFKVFLTHFFTFAISSFLNLFFGCNFFGYHFFLLFVCNCNSNKQSVIYWFFFIFYNGLMPCLFDVLAKSRFRIPIWRAILVEPICTNTPGAEHNKKSV